MSANVIAEIRGSEKPEEIVLIGAHLDSWDLATGAIDDGSGVAMVMETMRLLKEMKLTPRRTIRAVLFMNEENGLRGGLQYAKDHGKEKHVAAIETDAGGAAPTGFTTTIKGDALTALETRTKPLAAVSSNRFEVAEEVGADIDPLTQTGVPELRPRPRAAALFRLPPHERRHAGQSRSERARAGHGRDRGAGVDIGGVGHAEPRGRGEKQRARFSSRLRACA